MGRTDGRQLRAREARSGKVRLGEVRAGQIRFGEVGAFEAATHERHVGEGGPRPTCAIETALLEGRHRIDERALELRVCEVGRAKPRASKIRSREARGGEPRPREVLARKERGREIDVVELRLAGATAKALSDAGFTHILDVSEGMAGSGAGPGWIKRELPMTRCPVC